MGTLNASELLRLYTLEKITADQAIGHLLQHLVQIYEALEQIEKIRLDVERLLAFTGMAPETKPKHKPRNDEQDAQG